ncbi:MAG: hypothetical protein UY21_C0008G0011 [Microgenomates group bacterium GW2011_GWA1_48_10]|uniref:Polymerase nucleotidyl transferase domain-containing protein n=1 Tax=Candidatus Gottesmanbacteria bacterium RIFCSPHIGHO2_01_FULL_47_48 TaxID=1798381 RepID=A0A1F6A2Z3_9BACT|nr:MAG: hypothetical protein UY21_C0008G0011 [Microgenomates group bacterium GW2011_GWA1_48_10]OGG19061.1 MAG: hypothetical protein A2721_00670 [Candidatus Gottesmanbacteria bacterium RIFCSPHIGHO2_01_FULL_47_48]
MKTQDLVARVARSFEQKVKEKLSPRLKSFYLVGSYILGKISDQRPDINFLLVFDEFTGPQDYLSVGEVCQALEKEFAKQATIKIEFRPFRYIKPRFKNSLEVSVNPIIISTGEIQAMGGVIMNKWMTEGLKSSYKLLLGEDVLSKMTVPPITSGDLRQSGMMSLSFFSIPLSRAPAQYSDSEANLLLNESLTNAKNIIQLGVEATMEAEELANKEFVKYIENKNLLPKFYGERYGEEAQKMVTRVLEVRDKFLELKDNPEVAKEIFCAALNLAALVRKKILSLA